MTSLRRCPWTLNIPELFCNNRESFVPFLVGVRAAQPCRRILKALKRGDLILEFRHDSRGGHQILNLACLPTGGVAVALA